MKPMANSLRPGALPPKKPTRFDIAPDPAAQAALQADLGLLAIRALRLAGEIAPAGRRDWTLTARLTADVDQACVVTLAPVRARIDAAVLRRYVADWQPPSGDEVEVSDDTEEPLPEVIDLDAVLAEALALALPDYPRAPGAGVGEIAATPPGAAPLTGAEVKPFAALKALKDRMEGG
jgi:uncharacterized metal-binding protein YceD (DUF177 family)